MILFESPNSKFLAACAGRLYEFVLYSIRIKTMERTAQKTCLKKWRFPPLAPGIKESVDKCMKKKDTVSKATV